MQKIIRDYIDASIKQNFAVKELLAIAFIQETGIEPSKIEMVVERTDRGQIIYLRERDENKAE